MVVGRWSPGSGTPPLRLTLTTDVTPMCASPAAEVSPYPTDHANSNTGQASVCTVRSQLVSTVQCAEPKRVVVVCAVISAARRALDV